MARSALVAGRVPAGLLDEARRAAGLPDDASQGRVIRVALRMLAGREDPAAGTDWPRGGYRPRIAGPSGRNT
jgi:hypothetical protein